MDDLSVKLCIFLDAEFEIGTLESSGNFHLPHSSIWIPFLFNYSVPIKCGRVDVKTKPGHTGNTTAMKLSMGFSVR